MKQNKNLIIEYFNVLKELRVYLNQQNLAKEIDTSYPNLHKYLSGSRNIPDRNIPYYSLKVDLITNKIIRKTKDLELIASKLKEEIKND